MITKDLSTLKIHKLTQAQYDRELASGNIDEDALYLTPDEKIDLSEYATLEQLNSKADSNHNHDSKYDALGSSDIALDSAKSYTDEKLASIPSIDGYTKIEVDTALAEKANISHNHDNEYDALGSSEEMLESAKAYADTIVSGKADVSHTHDDRYYTETEIDSKLSGKADAIHNHDSAYDAKGSASAVQDNLDAVIDTLDSHSSDSDIHVTTVNKSNWNIAYNHSTSAHARTDATKVTDSTTNGNILIDGTETNVYTHPTSGVSAGTYKSVTVNAQGHITGGTNPTTLAGYGITDAESKGAADGALASAKTYADTVAANAANTVKNDLLNGAGAAFDTLKELGDLITDNQDAIEALETVASGKADKTHSHAIADVSGLQSALDGKAAASHGTHVSYSTTAPVMDGIASVGTASTVARSDHKHPTDTSRAAKTELDSHTSDTTKHVTATERTNWNAAKTHADSAHAPSNAQPNQNAFSNVKVGTTTVAADTVTDTLEFVGSNVTITPDATNDKITFTVADGSTSAKGLVQLTDSTSSTSTTTAATPNSVKSAYDLANTAKTNAATAQTKADSAYTLASGKVASLSDLGVTATATELNYVDGVTSAIQTQLDGKAASSHTHNYAGSSSAGGAATSANKVNSSLTVKLNGGTTEGADMFTFNGSAAKSVNITASGIGAAASSHIHSISNITNLQTTLDDKLSKSGGVMTGEITIGQGDGYGVQLGTNGRFNATVGSSTDYTVLGMMNGNFTLGSSSIPTILRGGDYITVGNELRFNGGDATGGSKIVLETNKGQITNSDTGTLFGYTADNVIAVGHGSSSLTMRGKDSRPTYNGYNMALASDIPTIPTIGNGTITIKQNGTSKGSFTLNQTGNATIELTDTNTVYTHPTHTAKSSGLYKITVDSSGHVSAATAVAKSDITALGIPAQDTVYTLPAATSSALGGVKVGSNITVSSGTISLTKANVTDALGYTPPTTNTTYSAGTGISLSGTTFSNSGVRSIATGSANGTISVNTNGTSANVAVKGLGSAAYTASTAYDAAGSAEDALEVAKDYAEVLVAGVTYSSIGAAASSHTHNYAGSSSAGGAATSANKVNTNLIIKLNSGTTEGTNLFTFNGSAAKTVNITPSAIGAAASSHTHSYLPLSGGTLTGALTVNSNITNTGYISTSSYIVTNGIINCKSNMYIQNNSQLRGHLSGQTGATNSNTVSAALVGVDSSNQVIVGSASNSSSCPTIIQSPARIVLQCNGVTDQAVARSLHFVAYSTSNSMLRVGKTEAAYLGGSDYRWLTVYSKNALNTSSDFNKKENIEAIPQKYIDMLDDITPVIFKFKNGDRLHGGYISQWVEESMNKYDITAEEFGGFCKDQKLDENENPIEGEYNYSLRYAEFIPIIHAKVKQVEEKYNKQIEELNLKLAELEAKLN